MTAGERSIRIDIGICTYRRPELQATLESLFRLAEPMGVQLRLIVADNDASPSARALVDEMRAHSPFPIHYVHCPESNISIARNACLAESDAEYLAFIDDDETATPLWLAELFSTLMHSGADAVLGPVKAIYDGRSAGWMRKGDFHSTMPVWVDGRIRTGYTCNVLLDMRSPAVAGRRFALSLGQSGGEDTHFFTGLTDDGGRIEFARDAIIEERVPEKRASFSWLAKRRFRSGQTHGRILAAKNTGLSRARQTGLAGLKLVFCAAMAAATAFSPINRNRYVLRAALHAGVVSGTLGMREIRQYGAVEAA